MTCGGDIGPGTDAAASNARRTAAGAGRPLAKRWPDGFRFPVHPHVLRRACGFELANDGKDTRALQERLGHGNVQHTVRYAELTPKRFESFWQEGIETAVPGAMPNSGV